MLPFHGLYVGSMHCVQTAEDTDTVSFAYDSPVSLPDHIKIWLTSVNLFLPKFWPKVTHPRCWFEYQRHSAPNCGRLEVAQWSQWRAYRKPFEWYHRWSPTTSPSPKWGFQMHPRTNFVTQPPGEYDRMQVCAVLDVIMSRAMLQFANLV